MRGLILVSYKAGNFKQDLFSAAEGRKQRIRGWQQGRGGGGDEWGGRRGGGRGNARGRGFRIGRNGGRIGGFRWNGEILFRYLTPVSDLDLAPDNDQFMASPPIRYINPRCNVNFFQNSEVAISIFPWAPYKVVLGWLKFDRGGGEWGCGGARNRETKAAHKSQLTLVWYISDISAVGMPQAYL